MQVAPYFSPEDEGVGGDKLWSLDEDAAGAAAMGCALCPSMQTLHLKCLVQALAHYLQP